MANTKRKDKSRKVLRKGESQRPDGTYQFRWTDENRKRHCIYARNLDDLRYKEDEIDKDKKDGIKAEARYTSLNDMYELWRDLKRGIRIILLRITNICTRHSCVNRLVLNS